MLAMSSAHDLVLQHGASCCFTLLCLLYTTLPINHLYVPNAQENSISKAKSPSIRYVFFFIAVTVQGFGRMVCDFLCSFIFQVYRQLLLLVCWSRLVISDKLVGAKVRFLEKQGDMFHRNWWVHCFGDFWSSKPPFLIIHQRSNNTFTYDMFQCHCLALRNGNALLSASFENNLEEDLQEILREKLGAEAVQFLGGRSDNAGLKGLKDRQDKLKWWEHDEEYDAICNFIHIYKYLDASENRWRLLWHTRLWGG